MKRFEDKSRVIIHLVATFAFVISSSITLVAIKRSGSKASVCNQSLHSLEGFSDSVTSPEWIVHNDDSQEEEGGEFDLQAPSRTEALGQFWLTASLSHFSQKIVLQLQKNRYFSLPPPRHS